MAKKKGKRRKSVIVAGARPNYMKVAPLLREMRRHSDLEAAFVDTGQHYDYEMSRIFFKDFQLPNPDARLGVGSGTHAEQTAKVMLKFERYLSREKPDIVVVVGDVNSTLGAGLAAAKLGVPLAHVEAGLRSFDKRMPEEINRILVDSISDFLFVTEPSALKNLLREGVPKKNIFHVGNVVVDNLVSQMAKAPGGLGFLGDENDSRPYALLTLHRPENVDIRETFQAILIAMKSIQNKIKVIFPVHPRTAKKVREFNLARMIRGMHGFKMMPSLGYRDFLALVLNARFVLTDSGTVQEETTFLRIPCLTLRDNTERPVTIEQGSNRLVGTASRRIVAESLKVLAGPRRKGTLPRYWDGHAAGRIVAVLRRARV